MAELVIAGLGGTLYYFWPMLRVPVEAARRHGRPQRRGLRANSRPRSRDAAIQHVSHGGAGYHDRRTATPAEVRRRHGIPDDAVVFGSFGRVTPEKGLTRVLMALAQVAPAMPASTS